MRFTEPPLRVSAPADRDQVAHSWRAEFHIENRTRVECQGSHAERFNARARSEVPRAVDGHGTEIDPVPPSVPPLTVTAPRRVASMEEQ